MGTIDDVKLKELAKKVLKRANINTLSSFF